MLIHKNNKQTDKEETEGKKKFQLDSISPSWSPRERCFKIADGLFSYFLQLQASLKKRFQQRKKL